MDGKTGVSLSEKQNPHSLPAVDGEVVAMSSGFRGRGIEIQHAPCPHWLGSSPAWPLLLVTTCLWITGFPFLAPNSLPVR